MKKIIFPLFTLVYIPVFSQQEINDNFEQKELQESSSIWTIETDNKRPTFTFDKSVLNKLEKDLKYSDYYNDEDKLLYSGARIVADRSMKPKQGSYIKLSEIPENTHFIYVSQEKNGNSLYLIRNVKTKELYVIHTFIWSYQDYSASSGIKSLIKEHPISLTADEQKLLNKYKSLIKEGSVNVKALNDIQKKALTRGYFNPSKVSAVDKKTFNKNLVAIRLKIDQISDFRKYEDKNQVIEDRLSLNEIAQMSAIMSWKYINTLD